MSLVHNERTKLSASALNGVAIASIRRVHHPMAAVTFAGVRRRRGERCGDDAFSALWLSIGIGLGFLARQLLGGLKE